MGKLIVTDSGGQVREFALDKERITIGRHPDNDISLNDKAVSGHHAVIVTVLQDSFIEDLDSTNGTAVNGRPVTRHPLAHGDTITLGRNTLRYELDITGAFDQTMVLKPGSFGAAFEPTAPPAPSPRPLLGRLRVSTGPNAGRELELSKALTTVGKPGVQVAAVTRRVDGYYIVHVTVGGDDTQRPLVNGRPIDQQARRLEHNDTVELAGTRMTFLLE